MEAGYHDQQNGAADYLQNVRWTTPLAKKITLILLAASRQSQRNPIPVGRWTRLTVSIFREHNPAYRSGTDPVSSRASIGHVEGPCVPRHGLDWDLY